VITRISSKGQIVIPAELRKQDQLLPGQQFEIERQEDGSYRLERVHSSKNGLLNWLMACPVKGFLDHNVSEDRTSDIQPPVF